MILMIAAMASVIAAVAGAGCLTSSPAVRQPGSSTDDNSQGSTSYPTASGSAPPKHPGQDGRIQVVTSFRPLRSWSDP